MRFEIVLFGIAAFLMANIYSDGAYLKKLLTWKKYYKMAGIAFGAFMEIFPKFFCCRGFFTSIALIPKTLRCFLLISSGSLYAFLQSFEPTHISYINPGRKLKSCKFI